MFLHEFKDHIHRLRMAYVGVIETEKLVEIYNLVEKVVETEINAIRGSQPAPEAPATIPASEPEPVEDAPVETADPSQDLEHEANPPVDAPNDAAEEVHVTEAVESVEPAQAEEPATQNEPEPVTEETPAGTAPAEDTATIN